MFEIGTFEAKNKLSELLDRVEKGEEIAITRRGKTVARLVPERAGFNQEAAMRAVDEIIKARKGVTLGGLNIKELINEGRDI